MLTSKEHSGLILDPPQGVWESTICNFETRELKLESAEQEGKRSVGCSSTTFPGWALAFALTHASEQGSEAAWGGEQFHPEIQAWAVRKAAGCGLDSEEAGARSRHEAAVSPDAWKAEGQAREVCVVPSLGPASSPA